MSAGSRILFVDRDGTLIEEPADERVDSVDKLRLLPGVIPALQRVVRAEYALVMVSNQDGLGAPDFPRAAFDPPHRALLATLAGAGIHFREVLIDVSHAYEHRDTRKPGVGLVRHYLSDGSWDRTLSAMVGDRETDMQFAANLGVRGFRVGPHGVGWAEIVRRLLGEAVDARGPTAAGSGVID